MDGAWIGRRLTVQGWVYVVLAVMTLLVVVGSVVGAHLLGRTAEVSDQLLRRVQPAQTEAYRLQAAQVNQETGIRGYAMAADRQFRAPCRQGKQAGAGSAARREEYIGDRAALLADLRAVESEGADWRRTCAEPLAVWVTPG